MFITKKHLSRRTFLRGAGVTLALPLLDSMFPALVPSAKAQATLQTPRFVGIFNPHGWEPGHWAMPEGPLSELPFILKPLEPWKDSITVISGRVPRSLCRSKPIPRLSLNDCLATEAMHRNARPVNRQKQVCWTQYRWKSRA